MLMTCVMLISAPITMKGGRGSFYARRGRGLRVIVVAVVLNISITILVT